MLRPTLVACLLLVLATLTAPATGVRVRDLVMVAGARDNQLVGYGLVAGLAGDGEQFLYCPCTGALFAQFDQSRSDASFLKRGVDG